MRTATLRTNMQTSRRRLGRALPALVVLASLLSPGAAHASGPQLIIVSLTPNNNAITVPPANISVQFNQCVLAPPSSSVELRSAYGTLVSAFISMPNCNTIQVGPTETLGSGQFTIFVYGITVGGSSTSMSAVFTVDGVAPAPPDPAITHPINDGNRTDVRVSGTGEPGSSVFVVIDDTNGATPAIACGVSGQPPCGVVGAGGRFTIGPFNVTGLDDSPSPASGVLSTLSIKATVTLTDGAGNVSAPRYARAFKDVVYPAAPTIVYPANAAVNANQRWTISGTIPAEAGFQHLDVRLFDNGVASATARAWCAAGGCAWHGTMTMSPGSHSVVARGYDAAGNLGPASAVRSLTVSSDTGTGPVRPSLDLTPNPIKNSVSASGAAQAGATVKIKIDTGPTQACATATASGPPNYACGPFDTTPFAQGLYLVTTTDIAANGGASSVNIVKDLESPTVPTAEFTDSDPWVNAAESSRVILDGNAEPLATVSGSVTSVGGGSPLLFTTTADVFGNWSAVTNVSTLGDGALTACVTATDARGNVSPSGCSASGPSLDATAPPAPVIVSPAQASTVTSTTFPVTGTAGGGATWIEIFEGTALRASGSAALFSGAGLSITLYVDGSKTIAARAIDQAGNVGPFSPPRTFVLAANAPTLASTTPPNNGMINPSGSVGATFTDPDHVNLGSCSLAIRDRSGALAMGSVSISGLSCNFTAAANALTVAGSPYTATVQVADPSGNSSPVSTWTFSVDDQPPAAPIITIPAQNAALNSTTVQVSGTAENGSLVQISEGVTPLGTASATPSWTTMITLPAGPHTITAVAKDPAGNTGPSATRSFTIDVTAPAAPVISTPAAAATVAPNTPVTGTAEAGTTVQLFEGVLLLGQSFANPGWSITPNPTLSDGPHTVTAYAIDAAGNQSPAATRTFTVDFQAPGQPLIITPAEGAALANTSVNVSGSAEAGATVRVFEGLTLKGTTTATPSWSIIVTFPQGAHTITADALDAVNNVSTRAQRSFTVDTTAPNAPTIVAPAAGSTQPGSFTANGLGERGSTVEILEGVTVLATTSTASSGIWTSPMSLPDGARTIKVRQTDAAGNVSGLSLPRSFIVDATAPVAPSITTPASGSVNGASVTVSGTAEPYGTITIFENSAPVVSTNIGASGSWSVIVRFADGAHSITAQQTDLAGNVGPQSLPRSFSTDGSAPDVYITAPASQISAVPPVTLATPVISGGADDTQQGQHYSSGIVRVEIAIFSILDPGTPVQVGLAGCSPACGAGTGIISWSYATTPLLPGIYTVKAVAVDLAGNRSIKPASLTFITIGALPSP